jgi:FkbM family methyltransferase
MAELRELVGYVEDFGPLVGVRAFLRATPGDYLMFQSPDLNIPLLLDFDADRGLVCASARVGGRWTAQVSAPAPRLTQGEVLELEVRFSEDGAELWIANSLRLYFPMPAHPASVRKVYATQGFTYGEPHPVSSPAPPHRGRVLTWLDTAVRDGWRSTVIYDVGMGDAADTEFYLQKGFTVVAIEPNPAAVAEAARRFPAQLADGQLTLVNMAAASERNRYPFHVNLGVPGWSSLKAEFAARDYPVIEIEVPVAPLPDFFESLGAPYYVKCSTEGYDNIVLSTLSALRDRPRYVSVTSINTSVVDTLQELGYTRTKLVSVRSIPLLRCPTPPREGKAIDYKFGPSSTGLFGEESPGTWQTGAAGQRAIRAYLEKQEAGQLGDDAMLLHAALPKS